MKHIQIKDDTRALLQAHANPGHLKDTSLRYNNAWWIEVDDEVYTKLSQLRAPGESFDDVVRQALIHGTA
jgi:hypothetical protein